MSYYLLLHRYPPTWCVLYESLLSVYWYLYWNLESLIVEASFYLRSFFVFSSDHRLPDPPRPSPPSCTRPLPSATRYIRFCPVTPRFFSDVGFVDFRDTESASIAKDRFKGHDLRGHCIGAYPHYTSPHHTTPIRYPTLPSATANYPLHRPPLPHAVTHRLHQQQWMQYQQANIFCV